MKIKNKQLTIISIVLCGLLSTAPAQQINNTDTRDNLATNHKISYKFDFGAGKPQAGYIKILPDTIYSPEKGYGFENTNNIEAVFRNGSDDLLNDFCTAKSPFYFSVKLPEGNYIVTVITGDYNGDSTTTVKAELRRLMLENIRVKPGQFSTNKFAVNIRTPKISNNQQVKLKDREKKTEFINWDDKLTLEFNGERPCVCALEIESAQNIKTLFLLGDSTVCDQPAEPWNSWGQMLPRFFKPEIAVANHAQSGESLRSSYSALRLAKVLDVMKQGDFVMIQFGHNDQKDKTPGAGAFTTYTELLKKYIDSIRAKGGKPILVTSMHRRTFPPDGTITNSLGDYPEAVRTVAKQFNLPLIDLHKMSKLLYEALGPKDSALAFQDGTHHSNYGSYELARCIVQGIRENVPELAKYILDDVSPFDPAKPDPYQDFKIPPSANFSTLKPDGN